MLSGSYWPISKCGSLKGAQHLYSAQGASTRVWKMSKHLAEMELESPRRAWAQDFSGTGGGEGLGAPGEVRVLVGTAPIALSPKALEEGTLWPPSSPFNW